jgi:hypothetical protein
VLVSAVAPAFAGTAFDPAELLEVDVHELARPSALVALRWLEPDPAQPAETIAPEYDRNGRERHRECLGDLSRCHPYLPHPQDHRVPVSRACSWRRGAGAEERSTTPASPAALYLPTTSSRSAR